MKPVLNTDGQDIAPTVTAAAREHGLDPIHLLALLFAESGLNPRAERWGSWRLRPIQQAIAQGDTAYLKTVINSAWPDVSFGLSQRIVLYHQLGDGTPTVANVLAVREAVFADPAGDIHGAAEKLAGCFQYPLTDGTPLSAMVVYNAGSDRRSDPEWMARWAANVRSYRHALTWAEQYRQEEEGAMQSIIDSLHLLWDRLERIQRSATGQTTEDIVALAEEAKQGGVVEIKRAVGL